MNKEIDTTMENGINSMSAKNNQKSFQEEFQGHLKPKNGVCGIEKSTIENKSYHNGFQTAYEVWLSDNYKTNSIQCDKQCSNNN